LPEPIADPGNGFDLEILDAAQFGQLPYLDDAAVDRVIANNATGPALPDQLVARNNRAPGVYQRQQPPASRAAEPFPASRRR
jgi:hypothetical protein